MRHTTDGSITEEVIMHSVFRVRVPVFFFSVCSLPERWHMPISERFTLHWLVISEVPDKTVINFYRATLC